MYGNKEVIINYKRLMVILLLILILVGIIILYVIKNRDTVSGTSKDNLLKNYSNNQSQKEVLNFTSTAGGFLIFGGKQNKGNREFDSSKFKDGEMAPPSFSRENGDFDFRNIDPNNLPERLTE